MVNKGFGVVIPLPWLGKCYEMCLYLQIGEFIIKYKDKLWQIITVAEIPVAKAGGGHYSQVTLKSP